jgi:aminoglycoside phosphotransferase family enzyme/predicted kinase
MSTTGGGAWTREALGHRNLVRGLRCPEAYPWRPPAVELIETHVSWVFLAGDRVVKIKRPVIYPFVDFSTLARRRRSCQDEVRLNRRLTDGVYLDAVPIVQTATGLRVGGEGAPVEWATLMRRLPASGMLDAILRAGAAPCDLGGRLAARLIPFHRALCASCGTEPAVAAAATRIVTENLDELAPFSGAFRGPGQFGLVERAMRTFITDHEALLLTRAATGWIREGHGDLRSEHVCLEPDGAVQVFDCVEFNRDLRCADVASDLAFLLMDLTRFGATPAAAELLGRYTEEGMDLPDALLRFYWAHRALVRAKVACLKLATEDAGATALAVKAADYLDLASAAALTVRPVLIAMTGLSGTGKSTAARRLARALGGPVFASDVVRKELAGVTGAAPAAWREGLYRPEWTTATYERLFALAGARLVAGAPVVLDAAFLAAEQREGAAAVAARHGVPLVLVETVCDEATVAVRLAARAEEGASPSDATLATYRRQCAAIAETRPGVPEGALAIQVDTAGDMPVSLDPVFAALHAVGIMQPVVPAAPACPPDI